MQKEKEKKKEFWTTFLASLQFSSSTETGAPRSTTLSTRPAIEMHKPDSIIFIYYSATVLVHNRMKWIVMITVIPFCFSQTLKTFENYSGPQWESYKRHWPGPYMEDFKSSIHMMLKGKMDRSFIIWDSFTCPLAVHSAGLLQASSQLCLIWPRKGNARISYLSCTASNEHSR